MGSTISGVGALADATASTAISTALQAQVSDAQTANVEALFGSLGLGGSVNTTA